jgi:hypothetical protein
MADWNPQTDPVAGYNARLGVYTTKSGRNIDKFTYQKVMGQKPKAPVNSAPKNPIDMHDSRPQQSPGSGNRPDNRPARDTTGTMDPHSPANVKKLQQFLKSRGYGITVDGMWGPQTEQAARWFRTHHTTTDSGAGAYNKKYAPATTVKPPPGVKGPAGTKTGSNGPAPELTSENGDGPGPSGNTGVGLPDAYGQMLSTLMGGIMSGSDSQGNVNKLATAMTDAKFGPALGEMRRQVNQGTADAKAHQTTIGDWFKSLLGANASRNTADDKNLHSLLSGSEGFMENMAKTLGDPGARRELAKTAGSNDALLRGLGANQSEFDKNMADALSLTGRDTLSAVGKSDDAANADLKGQLLDLIGQRGDALLANQDTVRNNLLSRQSQRINNYATLSMLPGQMDQQTMDGLYKQAQINHLSTPKPTGWAGYTAKDKRQLDADIFGALHDKDTGDLKAAYQNDPAAAVRLAANIARARGLKPRENPNVNRAVKASLSNSLGSLFHSDWLPMIK